MFGDSKNKKIILGSLLVLLSPQFLAKKAFAFEGIAQLKKEIQFGEYIPRTCVASLLAEKDVNEKIHKAALEVLESYGYPKETLSHLIDFKSNGPVGLEECLVGPYEDVTIITHGMSDGLGNTLLTYQEEKDGQIQSFKLLPQLFRNFLKPKEEGTGLMRLGLSLKQITLIGCGGSVYAEHAKVLRRLARENNLVINLQPEDWLISSILKKEGVVTESLIPPMIAENAQPEFVREVFCLIGFKESLFSKEMEKQNCLRGRYTVSLGGVTLGFSSSRRVVLFRQVFQNYSGHLGDSAQYNGPGMDLSFIGSLNPNFGTKAWLRSSTSYGLSVSIFESLEVRRNVELESPGRSLKNAHDAKEYLILDKMRGRNA